MDNFDAIEDTLFEDSDTFEMPPADIVAYNESRSVSDLVRMHREGHMVIDPDFQREFVWKNPEQTRFIDSMTKQLPIPSMCLSFDYKKQEWKVIDGLQRISTLIRFLEEDNWRLSKLDDINPKLSGRKTSDFRGGDEDLDLMRRTVENTTLPINVLRCDYSKNEHRDYIFEIFHRLNKGGKTLSNQEVRNCIYSGKFNNLLNELNKDEKWLVVSRLKTATGNRYRGQEIILRVFAFSDDFESYSGKLTKFLNDYMYKKRDMDECEIADKRNKFLKVIELVYEALGDTARSKSLALFEAFLVGCMLNIDYVLSLNPTELKTSFHELSLAEAFDAENIREGLSSKEKTIARMRTACKVIAND